MWEMFVFGGLKKKVVPSVVAGVSAEFYFVRSSLNVFVGGGGRWRSHGREHGG